MSTGGKSFNRRSARSGAPNGGAAVESREAALRRELEGLKRKLREWEERWQKAASVANAALDAVISMDADGHVTAWNPQAETIFGWTAEEAIGQVLADLIIPERYREAHWSGLARYLETGRHRVLGKRIEIEGLRKDGTQFPVELAIATTKVAGVVTFTGFLRDIGDRKQAEREIAELTENLERRVAERTAQLEQVNALLQAQIEYRKAVQKELSERGQELQEYIDAMTTFNAKVALDGTLLLVNHSAQGASDLDQETLFGANFLKGHWFTYDSEVHGRVVDAFRRAVGGEEVSYEEDVLINGQVMPITFSLVPVKDDEGEVKYIVAEGRDISQLKQTERALITQAAQLEVANAELEAFSHSVSHDLRAPLRAIDGFSLALEEDYRDKLDDDGRDYIDRIRKATRRMGQLIDDLLNLARVSRAEIKREPVDLAEIARNLTKELQDAHPDRRAVFTIAPKLKADADPRLVAIVMQNLLENAWKFTAKLDRPAEIEVGKTKSRGQEAFFVRDNGAGFDMAYESQLFSPFQRLHSAAEFAGTGIGLATTMRIVQRHGGRIWATGEVGKGATFYFTLEDKANNAGPRTKSGSDPESAPQKR
jgi:PAS domain S-box-containing protein